MADLSNRLPVLAAEIKNANVVFASAQRMTADAVIVMGRCLVEAKGICPHGEWESFLTSTGIAPRTAQRCMRIVRSGIGSDYLRIVGMTTALQEIDEALAVMPPHGEAMFVTYENEEGPPSILMWWRTGKLTGGFVQVWRAVEGDHCKTLIIERDIPAFYIAFIAEVADRGPFDLKPLPSREISRQTVSFAVRDEKIALIRKAVREYAGGAA
jgi:hypothetical protein